MRPAPIALLQISNGIMHTQIIQTLIDLKIPMVLAGHSKTAADLAKDLGVSDAHSVAACDHDADSTH